MTNCPYISSLALRGLKLHDIKVRVLVKVNVDGKERSLLFDGCFVSFIFIQPFFFFFQVFKFNGVIRLYCPCRDSANWNMLTFHHPTQSLVTFLGMHSPFLIFKVYLISSRVLLLCVFIHELNLLLLGTLVAVQVEAYWKFWFYGIVCIWEK